MIYNFSKKYIINKNFAFICFILFFMEFSRGLFILSYLPMLPTTTNVSVFWSSVLMSFHFISDAVANFFMGFLLNRFNKNLILNISFFISFMILFLLIFFPVNLLILAISSIILGFALSPIWIMALSSVNEKVRAKQMGIVYFFWLSGMLLGMIFMNIIFKYYTTNTPFLIALSILFAFLFYYFGSIKFEPAIPRKFRNQLIQLNKFMKKYYLLFPGIILQSISISALVPILPTYAIKIIDVSNIEYTFALILGSFACGFAMLSVPKIIDKNNQKYIYHIISLGFVLYGSCIFILPFSKNFEQISIIAIFIGFIYGALLPSWNTFMASFINSKEHEESWGIFNSIQGLSAMLGMPLGGIFYKITDNLIYIFYFSGISILLLSLFYSYFFLYYKSSEN
ncbi:lipoteichoic acid biosynthesis MFS flippase LtaA [Staphylococcus xylosus]